MGGALGCDGIRERGGICRVSVGGSRVLFMWALLSVLPFTKVKEKGR